MVRQRQRFLVRVTARQHGSLDHPASELAQVVDDLRILGHHALADFTLSRRVERVGHQWRIDGKPRAHLHLGRADDEARVPQRIV